MKLRDRDPHDGVFLIGRRKVTRRHCAERFPLLMAQAFQPVIPDVGFRNSRHRPERDCATIQKGTSGDGIPNPFALFEVRAAWFRPVIYYLPRCFPKKAPTRFQLSSASAAL